MMMMMVFLQSKLSCDECFLLTCRRVVFCHSRKRSKEDWEKNTTDTWGGKKKIEIRGTTNNNNNNERGGGRVLLDRQCIFLFATQKRIRFRITKIFFKLFYKKKNLRESLGEETRKRFLPSRANRHQGVCSYLHMMFTSTNHIFLWFLLSSFSFL